MSKSNSDPKVTRRAALLGLGALGSGAAIGACQSKWTPAEEDTFGRARAKAYVPGAEAWATGEERWATSSCGQCQAACGIRVRVVEGRAVRIEGNRDNPLNRGGLGPRGLSGLQVLYDPDRITGPLLRKDGQLVPTSWEEALQVVAQGLKAARDADRSDRVLLMSGRERGMMNDLLQRFAVAYGTPNFVDGRPSRSSVLAQAMEESFGRFEIPAFDWSGVSCVLSLEAGLLEDSCQAVSFVRSAFARKGETGRPRAKLLHAGSVFDLTASSADEWIRLQPGTAGALALGLCRVLLNKGYYNRKALEAQSLGLESFLSSVEIYTPELVSQLTGLRPSEVERIAEELAAQSPSFAYIDDRSVAYSNGRETALAVLALNLVLGAIEAPSGGMRIAPETPILPWPKARLDASAETAARSERMDRAGTSAFPRAHSIYETLIESMERQAPDVALLYYSNPAYARRQPERWRAALAKIPLLVSFSPFLDESVQELATVVLPDHSYLERFEDAMPAPGLDRGVIGVRKPVVAPLHDTRATGDVILDLSRRLGGTLAESMPWRSFREAVDARLLGLYQANRGTIRATSEQSFLDQLYDRGVWADSLAAAPAAIQVRLFAGWVEPEWKGDAESFPLKLLLYRSLGHAEGGGANLPWLHTLRARPGSRPWEEVARVHPKSAPGIAEGEKVRLSSPWGEVVLPIRFERRMAVGFVALALGGGHTAFGRFAKGLGVNALTLVAPGAAPITGASVLCNTRVRLSGEGSNA